MANENDKDRWFDVLTGAESPSNREEYILDALRKKVLEDAADSKNERLSDLDLQRGRNRLKQSLPSASLFSRRSFLSGIAAGVATMAVGIILFQQPAVIDVSGSKGTTADVTVSRTAKSPFAPDLIVLAAELSDQNVAYNLIVTSDKSTLRFRSPQEVPLSVELWLTTNKLESRAGRVYELVQLRKQGVGLR